MKRQALILSSIYLIIMCLGYIWCYPFFKIETILFDLIKDIVTRKLNNIDKQYYFLTPLDDHITILVPTDNEEALSKMRKVLSKKDIYELIKTMPDNETIWINDKNIRKQKYNDIINHGNHEQLVKLTKTLYLNKQKQEKAGKKFHVQDRSNANKSFRLLLNTNNVL